MTMTGKSVRWRSVGARTEQCKAAVVIVVDNYRTLLIQRSQSTATTLHALPISGSIHLAFRPS